MIIKLLQYIEYKCVMKQKYKWAGQIHDIAKFIKNKLK